MFTNYNKTLVKLGWQNNGRKALKPCCSMKYMKKLTVELPGKCNFPTHIFVKSCEEFMYGHLLVSSTKMINNYK